MTGRGSVLITVLWLLALLSIFALAVSRQASQELFFGQWLRDRMLGRELAKAAIQRVLMEIRSDKFQIFDAYQESWGSNEPAFKDVKMPDGESFSVVCEQDKEKVYGACDEAARINVNKVPEGVLKNLFQAVEPSLTDDKAKEIAQAVLDWRDGDDNPLDHGAEATAYQSLKMPYQTRNADLQSVEELSMVKGVTPELYQKVKPYVTVYSDGKLNFNTASKTALRALGLSEALAERVLDFRKGTDKILGTEDDEIFQDISQIAPRLSAAVPFSGEEYEQMANPIAQGLAGVRSDVFRVTAIGHLNRESKNTDTYITCVVKRNGTILYWKEGRET